MLLVPRAQAAIIGAAVMLPGVELHRHLPGLRIGTDALVIFDVGGDQHPLRPMLEAGFLQEHLPVPEKNLGLDLLQADGANAIRQFEKNVIADRHGDPGADGSDRMGENWTRTAWADVNRPKR